MTDDEFSMLNLILDSVFDSRISSKRYLAVSTAADKGVLAMVNFLTSCRTPFLFSGFGFFYIR